MLCSCLVNVKSNIGTIRTSEQNVYLGYTDGLLLHGLVDASSVMFTNTVEFIYSAWWMKANHASKKLIHELLPMQQRPPSASTRAPASNCHSPLSWGETCWWNSFVLPQLGHKIEFHHLSCVHERWFIGRYPHILILLYILVQHLASIVYEENS